MKKIQENCLYTKNNFDAYSLNIKLRYIFDLMQKLHISILGFKFDKMILMNKPMANIYGWDIYSSVHPKSGIE